MADIRPLPTESTSDDALVARLYELAREVTRGGDYDNDEFTRIDAMVYRRLAEAYGEAPGRHGYKPPALPRLDS